MSFLVKQMFQPWGRALGGFRVKTKPFPGEITRISLSSRITRSNGMQACAYLVGRVLIDAGFSNARDPLLRILSSAGLRAICLTHHHEDHSGLCGPLSKIHGCPIYLRNSKKCLEEGLSDLKPYRLVWWGEPAPFEPQDMPERIEADGRLLLPVPTPGHSDTHTAFFDDQSGTVFVGDLFVTGGVTAIMSHENPFESINSLRRVAALSPVRMLTGHGLAIDNPIPLLKDKADKIEQAASEVVRLHAQGINEYLIVRRVFPTGHAKDRFYKIITQGEFSRINFVRACIQRERAKQ